MSSAPAPPAFMAAETAARAGKRVVVADGSQNPARKFLLAGRGGLNLTHSEPLEIFLDRYGASRKRLEPAIRAFDPEALRAWAEGLGEPTFVGSSGRVFPKSFKSTPLLRAWLRLLHELGVELRLRHRWLGFSPGGAQLCDARGRARARRRGLRARARRRLVAKARRRRALGRNSFRARRRRRAAQARQRRLQGRLVRDVSPTLRRRAAQGDGLLLRRQIFPRGGGCFARGARGGSDLCA